MPSTTKTPALDRDFTPELLKTFDDPNAHGVHVLFNQWWAHAPDEVIEAYLDDFAAVPAQKAFLDAGYFSEPLDLDALAKLPDGSLGRGYHDFILKNGLEKNIAINYREFHEGLKASGQLARMPEALQYAVIRGFQIHDILHVLTGYEATGPGEIALQAFCLAQIRFPYFGMWMSVVTTRMTFLDPASIVPMMDAISEGWRHGRAAQNIQFEQWETLLDRPLAELRKSCRLSPADPVCRAA